MYASGCPPPLKELMLEYLASGVREAKEMLGPGLTPENRRYRPHYFLPNHTGNIMSTSWTA